MNSTFIFIISDHGFGHASRCCAVIAELAARPNVKVVIFSGVPLSFFVESLLDPKKENQQRQSNEKITEKELLSVLLPNVEFHQTQTDVGVSQKDGITIDAIDTLTRLDLFWKQFVEKTKTIVEIAKPYNANAVLFDISALGPQVAKNLNIPSIGISNFAWEYIYSELIPLHKDYARYVELHNDAYSATTHLLQLPGLTPMPAFDNAIKVQIGFTGRSSTYSRTEIRKLLNMKDELNYMMMTFGGHASMQFGEKLNIPDDWIVFFVDPTPLSKDKSIDEIPVVRTDDRHSNIKHFRLPALRRRFNVRFVDMIQAADVVTTKIGFGTVSECILNNCRPVLWTSRPNFAEEPYLVEQLKRYSSCEELDANCIQSLNSTLFESANRLLTAEKSMEKTEIVPQNNIAVDQIMNWLK